MNTLHILVAEDLPWVRATAVDMFQQLGATVLDARDGREALNMLLRRPEIAVLFADIRMPGMSGTELAAKARRARPDLRIVLTSAFPFQSPIDAIRFIKKPWELADLRRALE
jgi:CheY-like chemotaxis protein